MRCREGLLNDWEPEKRTFGSEKVDWLQLMLWPHTFLSGKPRWGAGAVEAINGLGTAHRGD